MSSCLTEEYPSALPQLLARRELDWHWEQAPRLVTDMVKSAIDRTVFFHIPPFGYSKRPLLQTFANNAAYTIQPWMREEEAHIVRLRGRPPR